MILGQTREDDRLRGAAALDWFVFPHDLYREVPPFAIGRACFDNWLVWQARQEGIVVDATRDVVAVHQRHDYAHLAGGKEEAYYGEEAARNLELAGGKAHLYTIHDASHVLRGRPAPAQLGATLRARETVRKAAWKLGCGDARRLRLARADAVPVAAPRPRRRAARDRADRRLRGAHGRRARLDGGAEAPRRLSARGHGCRAPAASSITTTRSRRACSARSRTRDQKSWSSPAGAPSRPRRRSRGAASATFRTSCSWRATTKGRSAAGGEASRDAWCLRVVRGAASLLVVGSLARESVVALGAGPGPGPGLRQHDRRGRVRAAGRRAAAAPSRAPRRARSRRGRDRSCVSVARLAPEKGLDTLVRAVAAAGRAAAAVFVATALSAPARAARAGARRPGDLRRRAAARSGRRGVRRGRRLRAPLDARAVGRRRQRGCRVRAATRPLRSRRCRARSPPRRRERRARPGRRHRRGGRAFASLAAEPGSRRRRARVRVSSCRLGLRARAWRAFVAAVREATAAR